MQFGAASFVYLLALVPVLLVLYAYAFRQKRKALRAFLDPAPGAPGTRVSGLRRWARPLCVIGAVILLVLALMQPQWGKSVQEAPRQGRDLIVLFDVSLSMLAEDVAPNRLERAKAAVRELVATLRAEGGHRLGLVAFSGRASLQAPLTLDYGLFLERLDEVGVESVVRRGTLIGDALRQTLDGFGRLEHPYTDLILLSDGEDHGSLPIEAATFAAAHGIALYTVGVGDPEAAAPIPVDDAAGGRSYLEYRGQQVRSRMQPELLVRMAGATDGVYVPLTGSDGLAGLYAEHIAGKPRRQIDAAASEGLAHRFAWFVLVALGLLAVEMLLRETAAGSVRDGADGAHLAGHGRVLAIGLLALLPGLGGDTPHDEVRQGNALYQVGQYEAAAAYYGLAAEVLPDAAEIQFNLGDVAFKQFDYNRALEHYLTALTTADPELAGLTKYNIGNVKHVQALQALQTFQDALTLVRSAIAFYRESLELDRDNADARYNLELAYRLLHEIERQQVQAQRRAETRNQKTSDNRGQPFQEEAQNQETTPREARPDEQQQAHGRQARQAPPNDAATNNAQQLREASLPQDLTPEAAEQMLDMFRERSQAAQSRRLDARRSRLRDAGIEKYW